MEELLELRGYIEGQQYPEALVLIEEMEEMSRDDKFNRIDSFMTVLLLHLIKKQAEQRLTRSWELSILNSIRQIVKTNKRRKAGGTYLSQEQLIEVIHEAYSFALKNATLEAFGGAYTAEQLGNMVIREEIEQEAFTLIQNYRNE
ncbi:DUF29 family protein [Anaerolineales bacterium HSG24]|nr:DUF29 family protein [Anaerolineales bacterium HSG24]